jgi:hypothetical protein
MPVDRNKLLALWKLDEVPFCDEGLELATVFMERAFEACEVRGEEDALPKRNAMIRAHKLLVAHRESSCPKCNEADPITDTETGTIPGEVK